MDVKAFPAYKEAEYWSEILEEECSLLEWRALEYDGTNDLFRLKVTTDGKTHHAIVKAAKSVPSPGIFAFFALTLIQTHIYPELVIIARFGEGNSLENVAREENHVNIFCVQTK